MRLRHAALILPLAVLPLVLTTPAHALTCPMLVDAVGDGAMRLAPTVTQSGQLDIVSVDVASGATNVVVVMRVASLDPDVVTNLGPEWRVGWRINGNAYAVHARRGAGPLGTYISSFVSAAGTTSVPLAVDVVNDTITWTVPRTLLPDLATPGATFTHLASATLLLSSSADAASDATFSYVDQSAACIPAS